MAHSSLGRLPSAPGTEVRIPAGTEVTLLGGQLHRLKNDIRGVLIPTNLMGSKPIKVTSAHEDPFVKKGNTVHVSPSAAA